MSDTVVATSRWVRRSSPSLAAISPDSRSSAGSARRQSIRSSRYSFNLRSRHLGPLDLPGLPVRLERGRQVRHQRPERVAVGRPEPPTARLSRWRGSGKASASIRSHSPASAIWIEQLLGHGLDRGTQPLDPAGGEGPANQRPDPGVVGRVQEQQRAGGVGPALAGRGQQRWRLFAGLGAAEPLIAQRDPAVLEAGENPEIREAGLVYRRRLPQLPQQRVRDRRSRQDR